MLRCEVSCCRENIVWGLLCFCLFVCFSVFFSFVSGMSGFKEPHIYLFICLLLALAVKGDLATNLLSTLPCCSTGHQNKQCLSSENSSQSSEFTQQTEESQNLSDQLSAGRSICNAPMFTGTGFDLSFIQQSQHKRSSHVLSFIMRKCFTRL